MRSFFRPPPNDLTFATHDLFHKQRRVSKVLYFFWIFLNLYYPLDWLIKTSIYTSRGHCKILCFQIFFHSHVWHMWVTMYMKIWVIWRWWKKSRIFKNWLKFDQMAHRNAMIFSTTSKSLLFWHTWFLAQTKIVFQGFIIFWIFY